MTFPPDNQSGVGLALSGDDVQSASNLVDSVLVSNGFERRKGIGSEAYYNNLPQGKSWLSGPVYVTIKSNVQEVYIGEGRRPNEDVRISSKRTLDVIREALSNRYGASAIKVTRTKS